MQIRKILDAVRRASEPLGMDGWISIVNRKYLHKRTIEELAKFVFGNVKDDNFAHHFPNRSYDEILKLFEYAEITPTTFEFGTLLQWIIENIKIIEEPPSEFLPNRIVVRLLRELFDAQDYPIIEDEWNHEVHDTREYALAALNRTLARDKLEGFFDEYGQLQLRSKGTKETTESYVESDRPWSEAEHKAKAVWDGFLTSCSEDDFIDKLLVPLFRQMRFKRIRTAGHRDKALEFGKDLWMKYQLPTGNFLYFGLQAKKGKIDAAANTKGENIATILNQINMMLDHLIFDGDLNKKVLIDHVIIAAAGDITKAAQSFIIEKLNASQRRTMIFFQRSELASLAVDYRVPKPKKLEKDDDAIPF